jgi:hypothetical protein
MLYSLQFRYTLLLLISKITQAKININFLFSKVYLINKGIIIATSIYSLAIGLYYLNQLLLARALKTRRVLELALLKL